MFAGTRPGRDKQAKLLPYDRKYGSIYRRIVLITILIFALWQTVEDELLRHVPMFITLTTSAFFEVVLVLIIVISALKLVAQQEQELERLRKTRDELSSALANDLRQPLVTVVEALRALNDTPGLPAATQKIVKQAMQNVQPLVGMAVELLGITYPQEEVEMQQFDCSDLLLGLLPTIKTIAAAKEVAVQVQIPDRLPPIAGFPHSFFRTIMILMDNAVRITSQGMQISLAARNLGARGIEILITDGGSPLKQEERQVLEGSAGTMGSADWAADRLLRPGLRYCAAAIKAHRGSIRVDSAKDWGNVITISLPAVQGASA